MRRTTSNADASAVAAAINAALGYPRDHTESEVLRLGGGIHVPTIRTTSAVAVVTTGGTSDGRFIAKICSQVVEFGPINATSHKVNESVNAEDIVPLKNIYKRVLEQLIA